MPTFTETFGLSPLSERWRDFVRAFLGDPNTPRSIFGLSSLKILKPRISIPIWLQQTRWDKRTQIYNFFNRVPGDLNEGYSVKVTYCRDFRGGRLTYDSHRGTDFAVPVGTPIVTCAPGKVLHISNEFDRGGLKVFVDHGRGLFTGYSHLSRTLVDVGDEVGRGDTLALSGASGVELFLLFPWVAPHLHLNVFLNGDLVDPFAKPGTDEVSLWRGGGHPVPHRDDGDEGYEPTEWDEEGVEETIEFIVDEELRDRLKANRNRAQVAAEILFQYNFYPTRFSRPPQVYRQEYPRESRLDLPFRSHDYVGVAYPGYPR